MRMGRWKGWPLVGLALGLGGCATTGATLGSGVGDRLTDEAPYYAGRRVPVAPESVLLLPIGYQAGAAQEAIFDPRAGSGTAMAALLREMNAYVDSLGVAVVLDPGYFEARGTAPDVQFGCEQEGILGECDSDSRDVAVQGKPWMRLAVGRPSASWVSSVRREMERTGTRHALVLTLEVGQYWTHQRNLAGAKEVRLGTGHDQPVPWLTSLDQPVQVLQLTGALVDAEGKAVRIGAEGLVARSTNLLVTSVGGQALIRDEEIERVRTERREELPGAPLVWKAALRTMVWELVGRGSVTLSGASRSP